MIKYNDYKEKYLKYKIKYLSLKKMIGGYRNFQNIVDKYNHVDILKNNYTLETIKNCGYKNLIKNHDRNQNNLIICNTNELLNFCMKNIIETNIKNDFYFSIPLRLFIFNYITYKLENNNPISLLRSQKFFSYNNSDIKDKNDFLLNIRKKFNNLISKYGDKYVEIKNKSHIDKNSSYRKYLISTNMTLFGNEYLNDTGESTYDYWIKAATQLVYNLTDIIKNIFVYYKDIINENYKNEFIDKLNNLHDKYLKIHNKGIIYQVLIPDELVNKYVFLSIEYGRPLFDIDVLEYENMSFEEKKETFVCSVKEQYKTYNYIYESTKKEIDNNIIGKYKKPEELNCVLGTICQARILITPEFLNESSIQVFYYTDIDLSELDLLIEELKKNM
jgi:hypothetical protein